jgi:hypothetical protein
MLLGQYSGHNHITSSNPKHSLLTRIPHSTQTTTVGKTTFIRYLLGRDFPGCRIGPEPTTDRFTALIDGPDERVIPGNALAVSHDMPYRGLERFGVAFLNRFEGAQMPSAVLRNITLIDTPGIYYTLYTLYTLYHTIYTIHYITPYTLYTLYHTMSHSSTHQVF